MGRPKAKHRVIVRDVLLQIMERHKLTRDELAARLDIRPKTLDGLLLPNPDTVRPASQDVQIAIKTAFPEDVWTDVDRLPNCGTTMAGSRISYTTRPAMRHQITVDEPIEELRAAPGDTLIVEPCTELDESGWWVVDIDGEDAIVASGRAGSALTIREADDHRVLVYQAPFQVRGKIIKHVRNL